MSKRGKILIADDEAIFLESTLVLLRKEGYDCDGATDANQVWEKLKQQPYDLLIADIKMPGNTQLELIREIGEIVAGMPTILVTDYPSVQTAMMATRLSIVGYLLKPVVFDELLRLVRKNITQYEKLHPQLAGAKQASGAPAASPSTNPATISLPPTANGTGLEPDEVFAKITARTPAMLEIIEVVKKIAPMNSNVLIVGETGTGKELFARAIHHLSSRQDHAFVPVDCGAIPGPLLESELFGYEKGAFTGAIGRKPGLLEFAHGGTLFLDEISELEVSLQAKLLRVLQEREFRRLGSKAQELINVDIRVISAMNRPPQQAMAEGHFREDLYYRLNVIPIQLPPLRERREDIPLLLNYFLQRAAADFHVERKQFSTAAIAHLQAYNWPGNIRQLRNIVERLVSLSPGPMIDVEDLRAAPDFHETKTSEHSIDLPFRQAKKRKLSSFEKKYIHELLQACGNDITKAAEMSGMSERNIYRLLKRYGRHSEHSPLR